ncbi:RNA polymerase subunit sigma-70 [Brumimicrobium salinarum]|uniref:RNA polymerase subunit sigma-70 n=1 Tax=Brumimicrobium salinarum TaxID=2058658 RepID=A0A2I0R696_9FLAO|nr:RNA polymerase sigma factor [Brumimicrobium salinarum]PKR82089.1 RNA polymerase subunit sigma-70 [Brumimicrobium salinarum]
MDDKTLVQKCISGNAKAQRELFNRFSPLMLGVAMRYIKDKERAEDILQDGFIKVYKNIHRFEHKGSLEGWIRRIVVNTALDHIRKYKKEQTNIELDDSPLEIVQKSDAEERLQAEVLMKIVQLLPEGYRIVFNMFAIEGYSHKEIAKHLNISESTSKSQYSRAKSVLRKTLKKYKIER